MASKKKPVRMYWDTCVFIALLREEKKNNRYSDLRIIFKKVIDGEAQIFTSAITYTELFQFEPKTQKDDLIKIRAFLSSESVNLILVDRKVGEKTQEFRQDFFADLDFEDTIHLAAACAHNIEYFVTYDGDRDPQNRTKSRKRILDAVGKIEMSNGQKLKIVTPNQFLKEVYPLPLFDKEKDEASATLSENN